MMRAAHSGSCFAMCAHTASGESLVAQHLLSCPIAVPARGAPLALDAPSAARAASMSRASHAHARHGTCVLAGPATGQAGPAGQDSL